MAQIRIVSDGTPQGTIVYDAEGKPILGIRAINVDIDAGGDALAFLIFDRPKIDIIADKFEPEKSE